MNVETISFERSSAPYRHPGNKVVRISHNQSEDLRLQHKSLGSGGQSSEQQRGPLAYASLSGLLGTLF